MVKLVEPRSCSQTFKGRLRELFSYSIPFENVSEDLVLSHNWLSLSQKIMDKARRKFDMGNLVVNTKNTPYLFRGGGEERIIAFVPSGHEGNYRETLLEITNRLQIPFLERPVEIKTESLSDYLSNLNFSLPSPLQFGWNDVKPFYSEIHFFNGCNSNRDLSSIENYSYCILPGRKYINQEIFSTLLPLEVHG